MILASKHISRHPGRVLFNPEGYTVDNQQGKKGIPLDNYDVAVGSLRRSRVHHYHPHPPGTLGKRPGALEATAQPPTPCAYSPLSYFHHWPKIGHDMS